MANVSEVTKDSYLPPLVISVHGIRTEDDSEWEHAFRETMEKAGITVAAFPYGNYGLRKFLSPASNAELIEEFYRWYDDTVTSCSAVELSRYDKRPSIVAHSLGSWIVGRALLKYKDLRVDKIILAGSILPADFDWATLFARDQVSLVVNECGNKDPWPGRSKTFVSETGDGGVGGFNWFGTAVQNEQFDWFDHSDSLKKRRFREIWLPILLDRPSPLTVVHGRTIHDGDLFQRILDNTNADIDEPAYGRLPDYEVDRIPRGLSRTWIAMEPDIYTFLFDRDRDRDHAAGYLNAIPVDPGSYAGIRSGAIGDNRIKPDDIIPYADQDTADVYLMSLAINEKYRRWGEGVRQRGYANLLTGFLDKLTHYFKTEGMRVRRFLAVAWTPEGKAMCRSLAMSPTGTFRVPGNDQSQAAIRYPIYEVDLEAVDLAKPHLNPALRRLLTVYRQR